MITEKSLNEDKDFKYLTGYLENIYVNDSDITGDTTINDPTYVLYNDLQYRLQIFNNIENSCFQIVYPDNVRAIVPYYEAPVRLKNYEAPINFDYKPKYNSARMKDSLSNYLGITNNQFTNTGVDEDYILKNNHQRQDPFPSNTIIIRKTYLFPASVIKEIAFNFNPQDYIDSISHYEEAKINKNDKKYYFFNLLWSIANNNMKELSSLVSLLQSRAADYRYNLQIVREYRIEEKSLYYSEKYDGLYFEPANIVISKNNSKLINHPFSKRSLLNERRNKFVNNFKGLHFSLEIVDNTGEYQTRYLPFGMEVNEKGERQVAVYEIHPIRDDTRQSGVYVYTVSNSGGRSEAKNSIYTIEEAESLYNLFTKKETARAYGNISANLDIQLENLKRENKQKDAEIEKLKKDTLELEHKLAQEKLKREEELAKQKDEFEKKSTQRKDYYEQRSYERKDNSEVVKYLPTLLVGVIGIGIALFKIFGS